MLVAAEQSRRPAYGLRRSTESRAGAAGSRPLTCDREQQAEEGQSRRLGLSRCRAEQAGLGASARGRLYWPCDGDLQARGHLSGIRWKVGGGEVVARGEVAAQEGWRRI